MGGNFRKAPDPGLRFPGGSAARRARAKKARAPWAVALWRVPGSGLRRCLPLSGGREVADSVLRRKPYSALSRARRARPGPTMAANVSVSWSAGHTQASRSSGPSSRGRVAAPCRVVPPVHSPASLPHPCPRLPAAVPSVLLSPARLLGPRGVGDRASGPWLRLGGPLVRGASP